MGFLAGQPVYAGYCHGQDRRDDPRKAADQRRYGLGGCLTLSLWLWLALSGAVFAEKLRVAFWNADLSRDGPGLLLRDLGKADDPQLDAAVAGVLQVRADVLVLAGVDFDLELRALNGFAERLAQHGLGFPYRFAFAPNAGLPTGLDMDNNGRLAEPRDAQGYGRFAGQGGMAILSRLPLDGGQDFSDFLWKDLPGAILPPDMTAEQMAVQRLASVGHWNVALRLPDGNALNLLVWAATPPVFDGPEDRNGRRNHDEAAFWAQYLAGALPFVPPDGSFILVGQSNLDPERGDGRRQAIKGLLTNPLLQNPLGAPTADYGGTLGALRVDVILPSADLRLLDSGTLWPPDAKASRHALIWVDVALP
ncbi:endonuclease/exonuclease/phosphatase family protein [Neogemmobacter tilapiae]|uniref:Endonuclease/exonuclease/phosphatase domain-containing protein n=1 Tax=Neogemmobacter tilapiae TaxID=875041 RepID=A0A918TW50_9RHOB|nr:endonuclease/exonuclease/phosphatase family protein [Gemmobacter tilapiae]GHC65853.1 hypothetical protein GCM10007315_33090 [Gemmobacter tilapiae]